MNTDDYSWTPIDDANSMRLGVAPLARIAVQDGA